MKDLPYTLCSGAETDEHYDEMVAVVHKGLIKRLFIVFKLGTYLN